MNRLTNHTILAAIVLSLLGGCSTAHNLQPSASPPAELKVRDQFQIREAVYGYLLQRDFWAGGTFSAVFLKESESTVEALIHRFPNHVPGLKSSDRVQLSPASSPIDKDTGRPAMMLAAIVSEPEGDGAEAVGTYYAGPAVSGKYVFRLKRADGKWQIESVQ